MVYQASKHWSGWGVSQLHKVQELEKTEHWIKILLCSNSIKYQPTSESVWVPDSYPDMTHCAVTTASRSQRPVQRKVYGTCGYLHKLIQKITEKLCDVMWHSHLFRPELFTFTLIITYNVAPSGSVFSDLWYSLHSHSSVFVLYPRVSDQRLWGNHKLYSDAKQCNVVNLRTHLLVWLTFAPWVAKNRAAASLLARQALCMRQLPRRTGDRLPDRKIKHVHRQRQTPWI